MRHIKRDKNAGPDEILSEFILELGLSTKKISWDLSTELGAAPFSSLWWKDNIRPVLKPYKNPSDLSSLRPIWLTFILSKLTERMIVDRLQFFLDCEGHVSERQAGYMKIYNTTEQIARLSQKIKNGFNKKQSILAVFVDFKSTLIAYGGKSC